MLISIIVPVYNAEKCIEQCASSLLEALPDDGEIILVDDGSKDGSSELCDRLSQQNKHIRVIHQENSGSGIARNAGISAAKGEYILFCDVDDWVEKNIVTHMVDLAEKKKADLVICGNYVHREGEKTHIQSYDELWVSTRDDARKIIFFVSKAPWCKLYRRSIIKDNNIEFPNQRRVQDAIFNLEYFDNIENCYISHEALYHYNANTGSGLAKKFDYNVFQMYLNAVKLMYKKVEKWNIDDSKVENKIGMFMLLAVDKCVTALIYRNADKNTRLETINKILFDETVIRSIQRFVPSSNYYKLLKRYIEKKNAKFVYFLVKIKLKLSFIKR